MSGSVKKRPFAPYCGGSQKRDKRICNRIIRRCGRVSLRHHGEDAVFFTKSEALNRWGMSQDGSRHYCPWDPIKYDQWGYRCWFRWAKAK